MKNLIKKQTGLLTVPFNVNFKKLLGVINDETCLVMSYLEMLFKDQPNGFMKFIRKCKSQKDLSGKSFTEDLLINERTFREAFRNIGVSYRSEREFSRAKDKFQDKYYCSITHPLHNNQTLYLRNHNLINSVLAGFDS